MATFISRSPAETEALGENWGRSAETGLVIALRGELGTGKTRLVQGLARGLDIAARVQSPTFALARVYTGGRLTLHHLDLYRLETREQVVAAGLEEYFSPPGVTVVEWPERWFGAANPLIAASEPESPAVGARSPTAQRRPLRWVNIQYLSETERRIDYEDIGH